MYLLKLMSTVTILISIRHKEDKTLSQHMIHSTLWVKFFIRKQYAVKVVKNMLALNLK